MRLLRDDGVVDVDVDVDVGDHDDVVQSLLLDGDLSLTSVLLYCYIDINIDALGLLLLI